MKFGQSQEDGTLGILRGIADPSIESGTFIGPKGMKGPATTFKLEEKYDNPETREMLWKKSCEAVKEDFRKNKKPGEYKPRILPGPPTLD